MSTVPWSDPPDGSAPEGLRERKKRLMRQQLSDTATQLFVEHGFDAVRVADVAAACGVSEKTVFNYFPTKEALVLDRWDSTLTSVRIALSDVDVPPVQAAVAVLATELGAVTSWLGAAEDRAAATAGFLRFGALLAATPALLAHQREVTDQLVTTAAEALATRTGASSDDPEPRIAATALIGLWDVQFRSLRRHLARNQVPSRVSRAVTADVVRAAAVIEGGLASVSWHKARRTRS